MLFLFNALLRVFNEELDKEVRVDNYDKAVIDDCVKKLKSVHEEMFLEVLTRTTHPLRRGKRRITIGRSSLWKMEFRVEHETQ